MSNININAQHAAQREIASINRALASIGFEEVPGPDLAALPEITAPSPWEVAEAALKAKDPATDKTVAALQQRAWLASQGAVQQMIYQAWDDARRDALSTLPGTLTKIQADYNRAGATLATAAEGPLRGHEDLGALDLSLLPANAVQGAADTVNAYMRTKTLLAAWRTLATAHSGRGMGQPAHWSQIAAPTAEQYAVAMEARPQRFPSNGDAWSIARMGWKLDLARNFTDAQQRRNAYREGLSSGVDTVRTLRLRGQHRAAEAHAASMIHNPTR